MTRLRKMMLEELERRNYSESTKRAYVQTIEDLARYFKRPPDQLEPAHIRQYQAYLFRDRKLSPNTVNQRTGALRFFFITVLRKSWSIADTPYPRRSFRLPKVLSQRQVTKLIEAATTPFYRVILMTLYATGLRRAELAGLKVSDVDSERVVIHVKDGKGHKDREVMLSPKLLDELRLYWRSLRRKPKTWLFPGNRWHTAEYPIDTKVVWHACREAAMRAGLGAEIHPHTLRHYAGFLTIPGAADHGGRKARQWWGGARPLVRSPGIVSVIDFGGRRATRHQVGNGQASRWAA